MGATDGVTPFGSEISGMRSNTCCRAKYVSVPSSNVILTSDSPYSEIDRITLRFGVPFMPASTGTVMRRSTSSAAWPGHCAMISTMGGEISGYASTGSRENDHAPTPINASARTPVRIGCPSDTATTRFTNDCSSTPGESVRSPRGVTPSESRDPGVCGNSGGSFGSEGVTGSPRTAGTVRPAQPRYHPRSAPT